MLFRVPKTEETLIILQILEDDQEKVKMAISQLEDCPVRLYDLPKTKREIVESMWQCYCNIATTYNENISIESFIEKYLLRHPTVRQWDVSNGENICFAIRRTGKLIKFQYWEITQNSYSGVTYGYASTSQIWEEDFMNIFYDFLLRLEEQGVIDVNIIEIPEEDFLSKLSGEEIVQKIEQFIIQQPNLNIEDGLALLEELELTIFALEERIQRVQENLEKLMMKGEAQ